MEILSKLLVNIHLKKENSFNNITYYLIRKLASLTVIQPNRTHKNTGGIKRNNEFLDYNPQENTNAFFQMRNNKWFISYKVLSAYFLV